MVKRGKWQRRWGTRRESGSLHRFQVWVGWQKRKLGYIQEVQAPRWICFSGGNYTGISENSAKVSSTFFPRALQFPCSVVSDKNLLLQGPSFFCYQVLFSCSLSHHVLTNKSWAINSMNMFTFFFFWPSSCWCVVWGKQTLKNDIQGDLRALYSHIFSFVWSKASCFPPLCFLFQA